MKKRSCVLLVSLLLTACSTEKEPVKPTVYDELRNGFLNPPPEARPKVYWWWLNGNTDTARLKEELRAMKDAGISGFDIFEIGVPATDKITLPGPAFLSDESLSAIKTALGEAEKLGLEAGLNMASSWNAGGSWIPPQHAAKSIYLSKTAVSSGSINNIILPFPAIAETDKRGTKKQIPLSASGRPVYSDEIAVIAVPVKKQGEKVDTSEIRLLSSLFNPVTETLSWTPPEGDWMIYRFVCSNSGESLKLPSRNSAGPIIDHFDSVATEFHFNYVLSRLRTVIPDISKSALKSLYLASYEATEGVWSPSLPDEFRRINSYDLHKFLPAVFDPDTYKKDLLNDFNSDFRRTLSEMMINNFYRKAGEISNANGLKINSEAGGPGLPLHNVPVEPLKALGSLDLPRGEFWINHNRLNEEGIDILRVVKEVSSASHIYNRGIVEEEAFTTFQHWQEGPADMKPSGDRAFCEGMNKVVVHGFTHIPGGTGVPGSVYGAGTHFNDKRIWWPMVRPFNDYLARLSWIFQNTSFHADVLFYYGDEIPNYTGHKNSRFSAGNGFDYEVINTEVLLSLETVGNKLVLPDGSEFQVLALASEKSINALVLEKLKILALKGAIITGYPPTGVRRVPADENYDEYLKLADKLWGTSTDTARKINLYSGKISSGLQTEAVLEEMGLIPDFNYPGIETGDLDFIHYVREELNFYFIRNCTDRKISRSCLFRQTGNIPELWHPVSGHIAPLPVYNDNGNSISIPLSFEPYESYLVIFRPGESSVHLTSVKGNSPDPPMMSYSPDGLILHEEGSFILYGETTDTIINRIGEQTIDGAWELFFPLNNAVPRRLIFPELKSWTGETDPQIKYFSGIVSYRKTFQADTDLLDRLSRAGYKTFLDPGEVSKVCRLKLNGKDLGIRWTKPYSYDVSGILKPGDNLLEIEVANTWSNRLKGDAMTGEKNTSTNIKTTNIKGLNKVYVPWAEVPLIESGLLGPVRLLFIKPLK